MNSFASTDSFHLAKVARILKISRPLALKMARSGELPCDRTAQGLRVRAGALTAWIDGQMQGLDALQPSALANKPQKK